MDNDLLNERISQLSEWEQQDSLNEILFNVFSSLNAYTKERFDELSRVIRNESAMFKETPVIKIAVCKDDDVGKQIFLHPVIPKSDAGNGSYITTVFAECDYHTIRKLLRQSFPAKIECKTGSQKINVSLRYSSRYLNRFESLYYTFNENSIPWETVNGTYIYKFLDVHSIDNIEHEIENCEIDFGQYDEYISYDKVLLWNIVPMKVSVSSCELKPAYNTLVYEHKLKNLQFADNDYLLFNVGERFTCFKRDDLMYVRTSKSEFEQFDLLRIIKSDNIDLPLYLPVKTNHKKLRLLDSLAQGGYIPTIGEAERIISLINHDIEIKLLSIQVIPSTTENYVRYSRIDFNPFMERNSFLDNRKLLLFTFSINESALWAHESMYYVLSILQMYFYEHRCVGEMV